MLIYRCILALFFSCLLVLPAFSNEKKNLIENGDFSKGEPGNLPYGWTLEARHPSFAPSFQKIDEGGNGRLLIQGTGQPDIVAGIKTGVGIALGKTYLFSVRFKVSEDVNPHRNLLFQCYGPENFDGIFSYTKKEKGWIEGAAKIFFPGKGDAKAEVRIMFRFSERGKVTVSNISLVESEPDHPRWVRVACTSGFTNPQIIPKIARQAAEEKADILLLPEFMIGSDKIENLDGVSCKLMSQLSREHHMYVAGGILRKVEEKGRVYNTTLLYDRNGKLVAMYDKIHPSSPEVNEMGVSPGSKVVVLKTDFGKVGFMTCYDSWFTDVAELAALKGAELILFPNAGYYRSIMTARAADNGVRIVASSLYNKGGIWDTGGRDLHFPDKDTTTMMLPGKTFENFKSLTVDSIELIIASLDLNFSPNPHHNNGWMYSAPGGRRNKRDQVYYLEDDIKKERERWWLDKE